MLALGDSHFITKTNQPMRKFKLMLAIVMVAGMYACNGGATTESTDTTTPADTTASAPAGDHTHDHDHDHDHSDHNH